MPGGCYLEQRYGQGYWEDGGRDEIPRQMRENTFGAGASASSRPLPPTPPPPPGFSQRIPVTWTLNLTQREIEFVRRFLTDMLAALPEPTEEPFEGLDDEEMDERQGTPGHEGSGGAPDGDH